jgi:hypothetical protein
MQGGDDWFFIGGKQQAAYCSGALYGYDLQGSGLANLLSRERTD